MIGAIIFILSMLVLGFCVISPKTAHIAQTKAMGVLGRLKLPERANSVMAQLADTSTDSFVESYDE